MKRVNDCKRTFYDRKNEELAGEGFNKAIVRSGTVYQYPGQWPTGKKLLRSLENGWRRVRRKTVCLARKMLEEIRGTHWYAARPAHTKEDAREHGDVQRQCRFMEK